MGSGPALVLWFGDVRDALSEVTESIRLFRTCGTRSAFSNGYAGSLYSMY